MAGAALAAAAAAVAAADADAAVTAACNVESVSTTDGLSSGFGLVVNMEKIVAQNQQNTSPNEPAPTPAKCEDAQTSQNRALDDETFKPASVDGTNDLQPHVGAQVAELQRQIRQLTGRAERAEAEADRLQHRLSDLHVAGPESAGTSATATPLDTATTTRIPNGLRIQV